MRRSLLALALLLALPSGAQAAVTAPASFSAAQSLTTASSSPGNAYVAGMSVIMTAPVAGDLSACAGSAVVAAPVAGDSLILAGSVSVRASVAGDMRVAGGSIEVNRPVGGDFFAVGFSVRDAGQIGGSAFVVAANATLSNGAVGPVTIYANNVALDGTFDGNVTIYSSGHIALAPGTIIRGTLRYEAPEAASIPGTALIEKGVMFTNASYLPDPGTSQLLAFVSIGFFIIARILSAIILAGLLAGLFPRFADTIVDRVETVRPRASILTFLLGFAIVVATPIVIMLLLLTFVGVGVAVMLLLLYALLLLLSFVYAGITIGGVIVRRFTERTHIAWHDGVLGMAVLSLVTLVPYVGFPIVIVMTLLMLGALLQLVFVFAFPHESYDEDFDEQ